MSQINDAIHAVVGPGQLNDQLLAYYQSEGAVGSVNLQDAEREVLISKLPISRESNFIDNSRWNNMSGSVGGADFVAPTDWSLGFFPPDDAVAVAPGGTHPDAFACQFISNINRGYLSFDFDSTNYVGVDMNLSCFVDAVVVATNSTVIQVSGNVDIIRDTSNLLMGFVGRIDMVVRPNGPSITLRVGAGVKNNMIGDFTLSRSQFTEGDILRPYTQTAAPLAPSVIHRPTFTGHNQMADLWDQVLILEGFLEGALDDRKLEFWLSGGFDAVPGVPPNWTTDPPNPDDGQQFTEYPIHDFRLDVDVTSLFEVTAGQLPSGLMLGNGGLLSGTPQLEETQVGIVVDAVNLFGRTSSLPFDIDISIAIPVWDTNPPTPPDGFVDEVYPGYDFQDDVNVICTFAVTSGSLPSGLSLAANGILSGTTDTEETQVGIQVTATNASGATQSLAFVIDIEDVGEALGPELITNGGFIGNADGWTLGTGWTYGSNLVMTNGNSSGDLIQGSVAATLDFYRCTFDIPDIFSTSGLGLRVKAGSNGPNVYVNTPGSHSLVLERVAGGSASIVFGQDNNSDFQGEITNVSLKLIL